MLSPGRPAPLPPVALAVAVVGAMLLAGCSGDALDPAAGPGAAEGATGTVASVWNVTTPHPGGAAYTRDYQGTARQDPAALEGPPLALAYGPFQSCCQFAWVAASDLFVPDQLSAVRVTLAWTNTAQDQANLDVAVCIPWYCGFPDSEDQTNQAGAHSETFDIVSGGHRQFIDQGLDFAVGARYSNLVTTAGVPFTVHVEVVPVEDALAFGDPYEVVVPPNATLGAQLAGPVRGGGLSAGLMVYGEDDRPLAYHPLSGADGARFALGHGEGSYVVFPFASDGALLRLFLENATAEVAARPLTETFGVVDVAAVTDPVPVEGAYSFAAPPGSMDTFPYFLYDSASAQFPGVTAGSSITLSSSRGVIADVLIESLGLVSPIGQMCLTCNQQVLTWQPENFLDDDGTYQVAFSSTGAPGRFVLFTATYSR